MADKTEVPFDNPVMTGVGATNRPHIMGLQPISMFDKDGEKWAKVPILVLGRWLHSSGILNFGNEVVERLKSALYSGVAGHDVALDSRHHPEKGALGWVRDLVTEVVENGKEQVSALTKLTKWGIEAIEDELFKYGSIEFHPNFQNRMAGTGLSFEGEGNELVFLEEGKQPDIQVNVEDSKMPDEILTPAVVQESAVSLEQLEAVQLKLQQMEERLEAERSRSASLEQMAVQQFVNAIVVKAENYRDENQRAHSKVALEWLEKVMLTQPVNETIQLEADADAGGIHAYYRKAIDNLFKTMPGVVPMVVAQTEQAENRIKAEHGDKEPVALDQEGMEELWSVLGVTPKKEGGS